MTTLPDVQRPTAQEPGIGCWSTRGAGCETATRHRSSRRSSARSGRSAGSRISYPKQRIFGGAGSGLLDPYGLVAKGGAWYLIAADAPPGRAPGEPSNASAGGAASGAPEPRMYRVSRIEAAEVTDEPALRPVDLDLEQLWESMRDRVEERGPGVAVTLRVRAGRADLVQRMTRAQLVGPVERIDREPTGEDLRRDPRRVVGPPHAAGADAAGADAAGADAAAADAAAADWLTFRMPFVAEGAALGVLLGFGADVEVLDPPRARTAMAQAAAEIVAALRSGRDSRQSGPIGLDLDEGIAQPGDEVARKRRPDEDADQLGRDAIEHHVDPRQHRHLRARARSRTTRGSRSMLQAEARRSRAAGPP